MALGEFSRTKVRACAGTHHNITALTAITSNWSASQLGCYKGLKFNCGFIIPIKLSKQIQINLRHLYEKRPHVNERVLEGDK